MSLKSRLLKNRELKYYSDISEDSNIDLLAFFKDNKSFEKLYAYSYNKIFAVKNEEVINLKLNFSSEEEYCQEIQRIINSLDTDSENQNFISCIRNGLSIKIILPPIVKNQPYFYIERKNKLSYIDYFKKKVISSEIASYFKECIKKKANIFILGDRTTNKNSILNFLISVSGEFNKNILYGDLDEIINDSFCLNLNKNNLNELVGIDYDNIFCSDLTPADLTEIFRLISSGYNGFCISLSIKNGIDFFTYLKNMILLSNINLFEENTDFLTNSSIDVVVFTENDKNGQTLISKISEVVKGKQNNNQLKDIFVFHQDGMHISTGNSSKFYNKNNITSYLKEYLAENHIHSYISGVMDKVSPESQNSPKQDKKKLLKEKFKKMKQENAFLISPKNEQNISEKENISVENNDNVFEVEKETEYIQVIDDKKSVTEITSEPELLEEKEIPDDSEKTEYNVIKDINIKDEANENTSNEGLLTGGDDFSDEQIINETLFPDTKIRNIFEEDFGEETSQKQFDDNSTEILTIENSENEETKEDVFVRNEENIIETTDKIAEKYSQSLEPQIIEEPQLFSEITDADVAGYDDDYLEIDDENI